jgi:cytochrome bd-type quinol oxidase subunit 2
MKINKKTKLCLLLALVMLNLFLFTSIVQAQFLPLDPELYDSSLVTPDGGSALSKTQNLVAKAVNITRLIIGSVAVLMAVISGVQLIISRANEETVGNAKKALLYSVIGLVIIALSADLAALLDLRNGGLIGSKSEIINRARIFDDAVRVIITFIKYIIGSVAVLMLITSGLRLVASGSTEETVTEEKKHIFAIVVGLVGLIFVDSLIRNVLYNIDNPTVNPAIDLAQGIKELVGFVNLLVTFVGPVAVLTLVAGGAWYAVSMGNDENQEKAKKMMFASLIGIILIYGAFGIVSTFIIGRF